MAEVSIRELRNNGSEVIDRILAGETLTVTRSGTPVAELRPVPRRPITSDALLERFSRLAPVDLAQFRADVDSLFDTSL